MLSTTRSGRGLRWRLFILAIVAFLSTAAVVILSPGNQAETIEFSMQWEVREGVKPTPALSVNGLPQPVRRPGEDIVVSAGAGGVWISPAMKYERTSIYIFTATITGLHNDSRVYCAIRINQVERPGSARGAKAVDGKAAPVCETGPGKR